MFKVPFVYIKKDARDHTVFVPPPPPMVLSHRGIRGLLGQHYGNEGCFFKAFHDLHRHEEKSLLYKIIAQDGDFDPIGEDETEESFLSRVKGFAGEIGRGIFENVTTVVKRLGWLVILSTETVPTFVNEVF